MPTVTVFTAERMKEIEDGTVVNGEIVDGHLILTRHDTTTIDAGPINVLKAPNGTLYELVVDNAGVLSTVAL